MKGISTASNRLNPFRVHHLYTLRFVLPISHFKNHLLEKINSPDVDKNPRTNIMSVGKFPTAFAIPKKCSHSTQ